MLEIRVADASDLQICWIFKLFCYFIQVKSSDRSFLKQGDYKLERKRKISCSLKQLIIPKFQLEKRNIFVDQKFRLTMPLNSMSVLVSYLGYIILAFESTENPKIRLFSAKIVNRFWLGLSWLAQLFAHRACIFDESSNSRNKKAVFTLDPHKYLITLFPKIHKIPLLKVKQSRVMSSMIWKSISLRNSIKIFSALSLLYFLYSYLISPFCVWLQQRIVIYSQTIASICCQIIARQLKRITMTFLWSSGQKRRALKHLTRAKTSTDFHLIACWVRCLVCASTAATFSAISTWACRSRFRARAKIHRQRRSCDAMSPSWRRGVGSGALCCWRHRCCWRGMPAARRSTRIHCKNSKVSVKNRFEFKDIQKKVPKMNEKS